MGWELEKQQRVLSSGIDCPSLHDYGSSVVDEAEERPLANPNSTCFYVDLLTKSEFLKSKPEFDRSDIVFLSASQLSHFSSQDSESELPPAQFFVVSSPHSQGIVIADSQPNSLEPGSCLQTESYPHASNRISQTTIPDSQDLSTDWSQYAVEVPATAEAAEAPSITRACGPQASQSKSSASSIPSRQLDANQVSFGNFSISTGPERQLPSQQDISIPSLLPARIASPRNTGSGFLTQPAFDVGEFSDILDSKSQSQVQEATAPEAQQVAPATPVSVPDDSPQPAQRLSPLPIDDFSFLSQPEEEFFSASENAEVVPDTSQQQRSGQHQNQ